MTVRTTYFTALANVLFIGLISCDTQSSTPESRIWAPVIRDLQMIMVSNSTDSVKVKEIQKTFDNYQITVDDYQKFYSAMIKKNPQNNVQILKEIEKLIADDMKAEANIQRKKADDKRINE
jgi:hypothetical protein